MFRLTLLLAIGIGAAMMVGGRDLTPEEMAELGIEPRAEVGRAEAEPLSVAAPAEQVVADVPAAPAGDTVRAAAEVALASDTLATPAVEPVEVAAVEPVTPEAPEPSVADEIAAALSDAQVWYVIGESVNVREGPSTDFGKVGRVSYGDAIEILSDPEGDWVKIRIQGDGVEGYVARRFLQDSEPSG